RLSGLHVVLDKSIHVARCRDMRPPSSHVWLEPFDQVEDAELSVHTRYQRLAAVDPTLARNVFPATNPGQRAGWSQTYQSPLATPASRHHEAWRRRPSGRSARSAGRSGPWR